MVGDLQDVSLFPLQQLMHAIAMVHKMQRLALVSSNSMDIDERRCGSIQEDEGSVLLSSFASNKIQSQHLDETHQFEGGTVVQYCSYPM